MSSLLMWFLYFLVNVVSLTTHTSCYVFHLASSSKLCALRWMKKDNYGTVAMMSFHSRTQEHSQWSAIHKNDSLFTIIGYYTVIALVLLPSSATRYWNNRHELLRARLPNASHLTWFQLWKPTHATPLTGLLWLRQVQQHVFFSLLWINRMSKPIIFLFVIKQWIQGSFKE